MLEGLDQVPWADIEHAYGPATDVPEQLRRLLILDAKVRSETLRELYGNVFHQGTRFPAAPFVVPFLIEMCASPSVFNRCDLLRYWGDLIVGYFNIQERPCWGDGERIYWCGEVQEVEAGDSIAQALHDTYRESLKGFDLLCHLLVDEDMAIRAGAAWVFACLFTRAESSVPRLEAQLRLEPSGWVRAAIGFALGELGAAAPLHRLADHDEFPAARCMAVCELARLEPSEALIEPLLHFIAEPIEGYESIPGTRGKSTGDAAYSISLLPAEVQRKAIPSLCDRLDQARSFDTMPFVIALLSAAFQPRQEPLTELSPLQQLVLRRMVNSEELWSIGNLYSTFRAYGLPRDREKCAALIGVKVAKDEALENLRSGLAFAQIGFLEKAREGILAALEIDPMVFDRSPSPDECWLLYAKAFAETEPERALEAYRTACSINTAVANRVNPTWRLADLLNESTLE
jgi:hypothetical protein